MSSTNMLITVFCCYYCYHMMHSNVNNKGNKTRKKKKTNNIIIIICFVNVQQEFVCFHLCLFKRKKSFLWDLNNGVGVYLPLDCHFCTSSFSTWHLRELLSTCFTPFKRITVNNVAEHTRGRRRGSSWN